MFYKNTRIVLLVVFTTVVLAVPNAWTSPETSQKERELTYRKLELFSNILSILQENYVEEINTDEVIEGAINGLLRSLDPHSSYLTPENFKELQNETQGSFTGIGIEITIKEGKLTVVSPIEDTPAYDAGVMANDIIVKIDDQFTEDMSPMEAIKKLRGPKGSEVTISIHRQGWEVLKEVTLTRDIIPVNSVRSLFIDPGIAYTRITNFQSHTTDDYLSALDDLKQRQDIRAILLDLRNNPGGLLNQAVSVADLFLDSGIIVYTKGRSENQNMVFQARQSGTHDSVPLIVLVNEGSASASEIVAGAIQDHKRGLILGTQTFGKGSVQTIIPLQDSAGLRMTTARYYTPLGRSIQVKGIIPDVEVAYSRRQATNDDEAEKNTFPREADLPNHFLPSDSQKSEGAADSENKGNPQLQQANVREQSLRTRLKEDNQVQIALNIIKGISLLTPQPPAEK